MKEIAVTISEEDWEHFKLFNPQGKEEEHEDWARLILSSYFTDFMGKKEEEFPYRTAPVPSGGGNWNIYYYVGDDFRIADGCNRPYPPDRKQNADRKRKAMNRAWWKALRETEENMKANGGAIMA